MRYTDAPQRRDELRRLLEAAGYVSSQRLAVEFGVSEMTIRRDLRQLAAAGHARRVPGGASLPAAGADSVPFDQRSVPFDQRSAAGAGQKRAIAVAAAALLPAVGSVALDAGTTVASLGPHLPAGLTVVTHSVPLITSCAARGDLDLIGLGGAYQSATRSFGGPATRADLEELSVDMAVLSATAVRATGGYCASALDAETKQGMARIAARVLLLVDSAKLGGSAPIRFATLDALDVLVTDAGVDDGQLRMLRERVGQVVVAGLGGDTIGHPRERIESCG